MTTNEKELHQLIADYADSVDRLDLEKAERIWSQSQPLSFVHPRGHNHGWDEIKAAFYLGTMSNFSKRKLTPREITVHIVDANNAWGVFYWEFEATFKEGDDITSSGRETQIWHREADGWKILHVHYSGMPVTGRREGF